MSPVAMMMIHNPATIAMGDVGDMEKAIGMLNEVKESILNAYEDKTGMKRSKLSKMMDDETWFNAKKAVELGFADEILFTDSDKPEEEAEEKNPSKEPEEGGESAEGKEKDGRKKKPPFEQDSLMFSQRAMNSSFLSKVSEGKPGNGIPINQLEKRLSLIKH
jgi:ATP-dependent Clp protease protease subunit